MVLSGTNHTSHIDVIQSGVSINSILNLGEITNLDRMFSAGSTLLMKAYGHDSLFAIDASFKNAGLKKALTLNEI